MTRSVKQTLVWTPRVLGILFALFLSLFALDVFGTGAGFWATLLALVIHLLPVGVLVIGLIFAWRWEWVGAALFLGFGIWYLATAWGRFPIAVYWVIAGPAFLVGILFLIDWLYRVELRSPA
ncbi:MAG: hypothetical protein DYG89_02445 [Caldilinea sp. CFX5]|nr:hypothetical protein [Caldilinea sp. CFX5]